VTGIRGPDMLTGMTEQDWLITLEVFDAVQSRRGEPGHDDLTPPLIFRLSALRNKRIRT
jgi:hypothetical protein